MAIAQLGCVAIALPSPPPSLDIPALGTLMKSWGTLGGIPTADDLIAEMLDQMAVALAPVRRWIEIVEMASAIYQCLTKIPDAILSLDPSEIFDCLEQLHKKAMKILSYFPPVAYLKMGLDLAGWCIDAIDACLRLLRAIDEMISDYINIDQIAAAALDQELQSMIPCGMSEVLPPIFMLTDLMLFVKPGMNCFLDPMSKYPPMSMVAEALKTSFNLADAYLRQMKTQLASQGGAQVPALPDFPGFTQEAKTQPSFVPFPPLGVLVFVLNTQRDACVQMYNVLAGVLGGETKEILTELPSFTSF